MILLLQLLGNKIYYPAIVENTYRESEWIYAREELKKQHQQHKKNEVDEDEEEIEKGAK